VGFNAYHLREAYGDAFFASLNRFAHQFGFLVGDFSLAGSGYSASYVKFSFGKDVEELSYVRLWKYLRNNGYTVIERHPENITAKMGKTETTIWDDCPFTGFCGDEDILDEMRVFLQRPYDITFEGLIDKCIKAWVKACVADIDYQVTEECFMETADDSQYLENGSIFYS
jgi:hypothetical protein